MSFSHLSIGHVGLWTNGCLYGQKGLLQGVSTFTLTTATSQLIVNHKGDHLVLIIIITIYNDFASLQAVRVSTFKIKYTNLVKKLACGGEAG